MSDLFQGYGISVRLNEPDDFRKIRETLTRIGIPSKGEKGWILHQSCHILHKRGEYAIVHFKEMYGIEGKQTNISSEDIGRRNLIVKLLEEWNLCNVLDKEKAGTPMAPLTSIKVIPHSEKNDWKLYSRYEFGPKPRRFQKN